MAPKETPDSSVSTATIEPSRVSTMPTANHHAMSVSTPTLNHQQRPLDCNHIPSCNGVQHAGGAGPRVDVRSLQEDNQDLRADNDRLRALIVERSMASQPLREEEFYSQEFRGLLVDVVNWVAKMDRSGGTRELSPDRADEIIKRFGQIGCKGSTHRRGTAC